MHANLVASHWALIAAAGILAPVAFLIVAQLRGNSALGQLRNSRSELADARRKLARAGAVMRKAEARVDKLLRRADKVRPAVLQQARETLQDSRALQKIAGDCVLVAENQVRRVILEQFPPARQARLRKRCLPAAGRDRRPLSV